MGSPALGNLLGRAATELLSPPELGYFVLPASLAPGQGSDYIENKVQTGVIRQVGSSPVNSCIYNHPALAHFSEGSNTGHWQR